MKRIALTILVGMLVCAATCTDTWAQATAQINGTAKDQSGAVLPGVEIKATQTETGVTRDAFTNENGSFVLPNLAIGPYRLEAALPGFRTFVQTGITLEVNSNPAINVTLEVGQVSEQVEVQANAAVVETRNVGVGETMENARVIDLPLNGRNMIDLLALTPASTPAPIVDGTGGRDPFSKGNVSVAGGLNTGLNYTLDGAYHNNPYDNGYMSMPFPDALQEFKVETGATNAQTGVKPSGTVSLVVKSGGNAFHGDAFEFVRNGVFNARNAFALSRDTIKRNQFGGTLGGPILKNKLFFFGAYQGTRIRTAPSDQLAIVPTAAMMAGDFTDFASPACNAGKQITLKAPFVNNQINPAQFDKAGFAFAKALPVSSNPCGLYRYGTPNLENDYMTIGRIDYQRSASHSIFGRYLLDHIFSPPAYDTDHNTLNAIELGKNGMAQAFTLGDTYLIGSKIVNSFHLTANRLSAAKTDANLTNAGIGPADIGVKMFPWLPHRDAWTITGGLNSNTNNLRTGAFGPAAGPNKVAVFGGNEDVSVLQGNHQVTFGTQITMWWTNSYSNASEFPGFTFNGQTTGLGMSDLFLGDVSNFRYGTVGGQNKKNKYIGVYAADTWKLTKTVTLSYGLRWEPFFPMVSLDNTALHFDINAWQKGVKSTRFAATPPGILFNGDPGFPGQAGMNTKWTDFSPRLGVAWDVKGDGRTSVRASFGSFYDYPSNLYLQAFSNGAPFLPIFIRTNVNLTNPWANEPGGDPFPVGFGKSLTYSQATWPQFALVTTTNYDTPTMQLFQWNLSLQKQIGTDWLVSGTYIGNETEHMWVQRPANPAVYIPGNCSAGQFGLTAAGPCSTTANTNPRRVLDLANPATGQFFGAINQVEGAGTANYNGLILDVQRRAGHGVTLGANYTWSHCIGDPGGLSAIQGTSDVGYTNPNNRRFDRGNCAINGAAAGQPSIDRRQVFSSSAVARTPKFANSTVRALGSGWQFSPIVRILSGDYLSVGTTQDRALNGIPGQRANQLMANVYGDKTAKNYYNPAAFALPALGTLSNQGISSILGPKLWQFDAALSRTFQIREAQRIEFRAEAFNLTNSVHLNDPTVDIGSSLFGRVTSARDPRIMQFALKYLF